LASLVFKNFSLQALQTFIILLLPLILGRYRSLGNNVPCFA
jgi:hypothetical protein